MSTIVAALIILLGLIALISVPIVLLLLIVRGRKSSADAQRPRAAAAPRQPAPSLPYARIPHLLSPAEGDFFAALQSAAPAGYDIFASVRTAVVGGVLLLAACANPPTSQQPSATTAVSSPEPPTMRVVLAPTVLPTLPPTPTAPPLPPTAVPTLAATTVPTEAPNTTPPSSSAQPAHLPTAAVVRVIDGDTVDVRFDGQVVRLRLIGIDTPEIVDPRKPVQCFGREASAKAHKLLDGQTVALEADPSQDDKDRYGRLLRYIWLTDGRLFNQEMIAQGYAFEYTYDRPYKYQPEFKQAEREAREAQRGLWSPQTCAGKHRPAATTQPSAVPTPQPQPSPVPAPNPPPAPTVQPSPVPAQNCDRAYPDVCIPPPPPDLDCGEIPYRNFRVLPPDPHHFDRDRDGIGCER